jgi:hypothetical protein
MYCGAPIDLSGLDVGDRDDLLARSRAEISEMLEEARRERPLRAESSPAV